MSRKFEYISWMSKADSDRSVASDEYINQNHPDIACYHLQQAMEKYLKAQLISLEVTPPRTHSIVELLDKISDSTSVDLDVSLMNPAYYLSSLEASTRYPGVQYTQKDYEKAIGDYDAIASGLDSLGFEIPRWNDDFRYMVREVTPTTHDRESQPKF